MCLLLSFSGRRAMVNLHASAFPPVFICQNEEALPQGQGFV
jgi:hypothetical protein